MRKNKTYWNHIGPMTLRKYIVADIMGEILVSSFTHKYKILLKRKQNNYYRKETFNAQIYI